MDEKKIPKMLFFSEKELVLLEKVAKLEFSDEIKAPKVAKILTMRKVYEILEAKNGE